MVKKTTKVTAPVFGPHAPPLRAGTVAGEGAVVRRAPREAAPLAGVLRPGAVARVLSENDGWQHVKTANFAGYVRAEDVQWEAL